MKLSVRKKLLLAFTSTILTSILITCIVLGLQIRDLAIATFHDSAAKELEQIDRAIGIFVDKALKMTTMIATSPIVQAADESVHSYVEEKRPLSPKDISRSDVERDMVAFFKLINKIHPEYVEVFIGTKWGGFASSGESEMPPGYDPRKRPWYAKAMETPDKASISPAYMSTTGEAVISNMFPITAGSEIIGCSGLDVGLGVLTDLIKKSPMGRTGYVMLVQDDGTILANPRHDDMNFKKMKEAGVPALAQLDGITTGGMEVAMDERQWFAQVHTIEGLGWKLIGVIEKSEVMAEFYAMLQKMAVMGAILLAVFLALATIFANAIAQPVLNATAMLKDVAQGEGDLTRKLAVTSRDEIGEMATWFNTFLEKLRGIIRDVVANGDTLNSASDSLLGIANDLRTGAAGATRKSQTVTAATHDLNSRFGTVAAAMEQTTQNTNMVATATEEQSVATRDIAGNVAQASQGLQEINVNVAESSTVIKEISREIADVSSASESTQQNTDEVAHKVEELRVLASNLFALLGRFRT